MKIFSRTTTTVTGTGIQKPKKYHTAKLCVVAFFLGAGANGWLANKSNITTNERAHWPASKVYASPASAKKSIEWLSEVIGINPNFTLYKGEFKNASTAFADIVEKKRFVVYDQAKFKFGADEVYWKEIGVLAHELGHHVAGHTAVGHKDAHAKELEADKFAGYALALLGANEKQATLWTRILSDKPSKSHPERTKRIIAAQQGWQQGHQLLTNGGLTCHTQWIGGEFDIEGHTCRIARQCNSEREGRINLACEELDDNGEIRWSWKG